MTTTVAPPTVAPPQGPDPAPPVAQPLLDIAEMAERSGITATALRWYESTGLLLAAPHRTRGGQRRYDEAHVRWLHLLTCRRGTGMPIATMRAYAALCREGEGTEAARLALLEEHRDVARARLAQAQHDLDAIEAKVALYRSTTQEKVHP